MVSGIQKYCIVFFALMAMLLAMPADAASKKKSGNKSKGKTESARVVEAHPMGISCFLNGMLGAKQQKGCGG